jgi:hypothetical protein
MCNNEPAANNSRFFYAVKIVRMKTIFTDPGFKIAMIRLSVKLLEWWLIAMEKRKAINRNAVVNETGTN